MTNTCTHIGRHMLPLDSIVGTDHDGLAISARTLGKRVIVHCWEEDVEPGQLELAETVLGRKADSRRLVEATDVEYEALRDVMYEAASYMEANDYAGDTDFPEDAAADRIMQGREWIVSRCTG